MGRSNAFYGALLGCMAAVWMVGAAAQSAIGIAPPGLAASSLAPGLANQPASFPHRPSQKVPDRYLVVFKSVVSDPEAEADKLVRPSGGRLHHVYKSAIKGFAASLPAQALAGIQNNPNVVSVEPDQIVSASTWQAPATWGLDRIDQADRPLDGQYEYRRTGKGVYVFVLDSGLRADHEQFAGRTLPGFAAIADGRGTDDCNGHGTHVAGTAVGATWGVAKAATLIPVRVLGCDAFGLWSGIIAGIDWVASSPLRPAVANMSIVGDATSAVDAAVAGAVAKGVTVVVAGGNDNAIACNYSPARAPEAITVGATGSDDARASYSNFGRCLDLFAPGTAVQSAWYTGATASATLTGTSMATAHVSGVAALVLEAQPAASPAAVDDFIKTSATAGRLTTIGNESPNRLLYSLGAGAAPQPAQITTAVRSLTGRTVLVRRGWQATATISVRDVASGVPVANANVSGAFVPGGEITCTTDGTGSCSVTLVKLGEEVTVTEFTIDAISAAGTVYDASQNRATRILLFRP